MRLGMVQQPWFIGTIIGTIGGALWFALCVFSLWLCRRRQRNRKYPRSNGVVSGKLLSFVITRSYLFVISWPATMWGPAMVVVHVVHLSVCLSVCHMQISQKLSEIDLWLLGNLNRSPGFSIQCLLSDSRSQVRFRHCCCFRVAFLITH